jgi:hypothetical protein
MSMGFIGNGAIAPVELRGWLACQLHTGLSSTRPVLSQGLSASLEISETQPQTRKGLPVVQRNLFSTESEKYGSRSLMIDMGDNAKNARFEFPIDDGEWRIFTREMAKRQKYAILNEVVS